MGFRAGLLDGLAEGWKSPAASTGRPSGVKQIPEGFPADRGLFQWWVRPAGWIDTKSVGDGTSNSIVIAALMILMSSFSEPSFAVFDETDDPRHPERIRAHPLELLYRKPNKFFVGDLLDHYIIMSTHIDGNAYLRKVRNGANRIIELWPMMPGLVEPKGTSTEFITHYEYNPGLREPQKIAVEDIVHLKIGLDPNDYKKGLAPVKAALREILTDEEAGMYSTALLKNMGIPGVVISPKNADDTGPDPLQAERMADEYEDRFSGKNRGRPLFVEGGPIDVKVVSFSPDQMDFKTIRRLPEERVCADLGVPPALAYMGAGMEMSSGRNELQVLSKHFTRRKLKPTWRLIGQQLTAQLGEPDFWEGNDMLRAGYDLSEVEDLKEDLDLSIGRLERGVVAGTVMVSEHRQALGLDVDDTHEVFLRPASSLPVTAAGETVLPDPGVDE